MVGEDGSFRSGKCVANDILTNNKQVVEWNFAFIDTLVFVQQRLCPKDLLEYHLPRTERVLRFVVVVAGRMLECE
jgi:hypothetical protein